MAGSRSLSIILKVDLACAKSARYLMVSETLRAEFEVKMIPLFNMLTLEVRQICSECHA